MMRAGELTVKIKVSRWFAWFYLPLFKMTLSLGLLINDEYEPSLERLEYWALKSVKVVK